MGELPFDDRSDPPKITKFQIWEKKKREKREKRQPGTCFYFGFLKFLIIKPQFFRRLRRTFRQLLTIVSRLRNGLSSASREINNFKKTQICRCLSTT